MKKPDFIKPDDPLPPSPLRENPQIEKGVVVGWFGKLVVVVGLITWFSAYAGLDDLLQAWGGVGVTCFGITWWIGGLILSELESRK